MWNPVLPSERAFIKAASKARRLFVFRWHELVSPEVDPYFRLRPNSRELLTREQQSIVIEGNGKRKLNGSTLYAALADEEWIGLPDSVLGTIRQEDVRADPMGYAERVLQELSLAGFSQENLFGAVRKVLVQHKISLDDQLHDIRTWHAQREHKRPFRLMIPAELPTRQTRTNGWQCVPFKELDGQIRHIIHAENVSRPGTIAEQYLTVDVEARDPRAAVLQFQESYERFQLRLSPPYSPPEIGGMVFVHDSFPGPDGRLVRFRMPPRYPYPVLPRPTSKEMALILRASKQDPIIGVMLDQLLLAQSALTRDSIRDAFEALVPLLDVGFAIAQGSWAQRTAFARTVDISAMLWAFHFPHALFQHLRAYLSKPCPMNGKNANKTFMTGNARIDLETLTTPDRWARVKAAYSWHDLLARRRTMLVDITNNARSVIQPLHRHARWDIARAVRGRHAFAHQGEPMSDAYVLAVAIQAVYLCLAARCSAALHGIEFHELVQRLDTVMTNPKHRPDWHTYIRDGAWSIAQALYPERDM